MPGRRALLGITGPPGAGKTTLARAVVAALGPELASLVPMDGFHLADPTLVAWGRRARKGAPDTFDVGGYVSLLRRLTDQQEEYVHAPEFDRALEASLGSALPVRRDVPLVVTEGNYLLTAEGEWAQVGPLLDESWYLQLPDDVRVDRLVRRREGYGTDHEEARRLGDRQRPGQRRRRRPRPRPRRPGRHPRRLTCPRVRRHAAAP